jgi:hypothetical protein
VDTHVPPPDPGPTEPEEPDWPALGQRLSEHMATMMHSEKSELFGGAFYGEALRRLVAAEYLNGLTTVARAEKQRAQEHATLRFNATHGQERAHEAESRYQRLVQITQWRRRYEAAQLLRQVATHQMSKYRREGWEQAIEWLWPAALPAPPELVRPDEADSENPDEVTPR